MKKKQKKVFFLCQAYKPTVILNEISKVDQHTSGQSTAPNDARTITYKAWNSPVGYPSRECEHDIKESEGNMFNPIFMERKHPHLQNQNCYVTESLSM